jgi:hypothetical protein
MTTATPVANPSTIPAEADPATAPAVGFFQFSTLTNPDSAGGPNDFATLDHPGSGGHFKVSK